MSGQVSVWDAPTRIFHWGVVSLVAVAWFTADNGFIRAHWWSGVILMTLLIFRIAWGLVGSTTARFSDFVTHPRRVGGYLRALLKGDSPLHAGHNPAGGWMVLLMMAGLATQISTGLFANDGLRFKGPLATLISAEASDAMTNLHGTMFNLILLLGWIHVVAVFYYLCVKGQNLIAAMFTGMKPSTHIPSGLQLRFAPISVAFLLLAFAALLAWWIVRQ